MDNLEIIKLKPEDWQYYRYLRLEALQNDPQAFGSSYQDNLQKPDSYWHGRLEDAVDGKKSWLLFAKENDRLIGMIGAFVEDEKDVAEIISLYVTKNERGKGVSQELMTGILQEIGQNDSIRKAKLVVNVNEIPAVTLYKNFGFQIAGEKNLLLGDGTCYKEYIMEKLLV